MAVHDNPGATEARQDFVGKGGTDSMVVVKMFSRAAVAFNMGTGGLVRVEMHSDTKPGVVSIKDIELDDVSSKEQLRQAVGIAAGALAEYQCEKYGDVHEPSYCARAGLEAFEELWADLTQRGVL